MIHVIVILIYICVCQMFTYSQHEYVCVCVSLSEHFKLYAKIDKLFVVALPNIVVSYILIFQSYCNYYSVYKNYMVKHLFYTFLVKNNY